jgi:hypothetical protein
VIESHHRGNCELPEKRILLFVVLVRTGNFPLIRLLKEPSAVLTVAGAPSHKEHGAIEEDPIYWIGAKILQQVETPVPERRIDAEARIIVAIEMVQPFPVVKDHPPVRIPLHDRFREPVEIHIHNGPYACLLGKRQKLTENVAVLFGGKSALEVHLVIIEPALHVVLAMEVNHICVEPFADVDHLLHRVIFHPWHIHKV